MTLQDICTSQETSRKLKEAGFEQENGIAYWCRYDTGWKLEINHGFNLREYIRAFTFSELWDLLPKKIETKNFTYYKHLNNDDVISYYCEAYNYIGDIDIGEDGEPGLILISFEIEQGENLSCAAAELALWCRKEGYE